MNLTLLSRTEAFKTTDLDLLIRGHHKKHVIENVTIRNSDRSEMEELSS